MIIEEKILPKDWTTYKLGEVCNIQTGKYDANHAKPNGRFRFYTCAYEYMFCDTNRFKGESLILPGNGANVGEVFYYNGEFDAYQRTYILNEIKTYPKYLYYHLLCNWKKRNLDKQFGSATNYIRMGNFTDYIIPVPPKPTQEAIVSKIEKLFSELDKAIENLRLAQQQLKTYRQSVLKWAFEGKLTNENINSDKLPEGWKKVSITDLAEKNKYALKAGPFGSSLKKEFYVEKGYKIYGQEQVINDDAFYGDYYINEEKYQELNSCKIKPFDILISLVGTVGKVLLLPENCQPGIINPRLIKISLDKEVYSPKFFKYYFESSFVKSFYNAETRGTTMDVLNLGIIKTIPFPFCSITEQNKIIQGIESRLSVADKMEESIMESLQQADALRQSILKKAFEGNLSKEQEEHKPKKLYFYQTQTLGYISYYSSKHNIEHGEMTIAKYSYILDKIYNVPTYYTYDRWHLGPYPPDMKKVVNNKEFFNNNNGKLEVADTEKLFKYNYPNKEKVASAIDDLANIFSAYSKRERSHKTELLATVCKVIEDIQSTDLLLVRQSMKDWKIDLPNSVYKNKAEKFSEDETEKCVEFIVRKTWDKELVK